jgi:hypothetical protein
VAGPTVIPSRPWLSHFIIFHNIWDNPSHWRTRIFQDG